jgi:valyl-tRNA synthetase
MNVPNSRKAKVYVVVEDTQLGTGLAFLKQSAVMMAAASDFIIQTNKDGIADDAVSIVVPDATVYVPLEELIDFEQEIERLTKEEVRLGKEIARSNGMLNNERFVSKAPAKLVEAEKEKLAKYQDMKAKCVAQLESL